MRNRFTTALLITISLAAIPSSKAHTFTKIADINTDIPGASAKFKRFDGAIIQNSNIVFYGSDNASNEGFYRWNGSTLSKLVDKNTAIPGGGGSFTFFSSDNHFGNGEDLLFSANTTFGAGLYKSSGGILSRLVDTTFDIPGRTDKFWRLRSPFQNNSQYVFVGYNTNFMQGIYLLNGPNVSILVNADQGTLPGTSATFTASDSGVPSAGQIAFYARKTDNSQGIYCYSGGQISLVADTNTVVPGREVKFTSFTDGPTIYNGKVIFNGIFPGGRGIYLAFGDGSSLTKLVDTDTVIPGTADKFNDLSFNAFANGKLIFGGGTNVAQKGGIYQYEYLTQNLTTIADSDTLLAGQKAWKFELSLQSLQHSGEIVFVARMGSYPVMTNPAVFTTLVGGADPGPTFTLTTNVSPSGAGSIGLTPPGGTYSSNATVGVVATANAGFKFSHWTGASTAHTNSILVTMNANKTLTAVFTNAPIVVNFTLMTSASPISGGTVQANPPGPSYASNTPVTVTATANVGFKFSHWIGLKTTLNPAIVTMRTNKSVTAVFTNLPVYLLSTNVNPSGAGSIALSPSSPSNTYPRGTVVTLTANANGTNQFAAWLGAGSFSNQVGLTMNGSKSVTALFNNPGQFVIYNTNGQSAVMFMQNTQRLGSVLLNNGLALATRWRLMGAGDFNNDGSKDILLWSTNGQVAAWGMQGNIRTSTTLLKSIGTAWRVGGVADFNNDGNADILWHNPGNGKLVVWQANGTTNPTTIQITNTVALGWRAAAAANFGGASTPDIVLQNTDGRVALWMMNGFGRSGSAIAPRSTTTAGVGFQVVGATDLDGDGHTDIIFQRSDGTLKVWYFTGTTFNSQVTLPSKVAPGWKLRVVK